MKRYFKTYQQATQYANERAKTLNKSVSLTRQGAGWIVEESGGVNSESNSSINDKEGGFNISDNINRQETISSKNNVANKNIPNQYSSCDEEKEWKSLCDKAEKLANIGEGNVKELYAEFQGLLSRRNRYAVKAYNDLMFENYDPTKPGRSPGFEEGARLFIEFSTELPILRG